MNTTPDEVQIRIGDWSELGVLALPLRLAVFVQEQGVPVELEQDEYDELATHVVVCGPDGSAIATGRLVLLDDHTAKIGRLAVAKSFRAQGYGRVVLNALIEHAQAMGVRTLKLHAQGDAHGFYESFGFHALGEPFMEAGIIHVLMVRDLEAGK